MPRFRTAKDVLENCVKKGMLRTNENLELERARSLFCIALEDKKTFSELLTRQDRWNTTTKIAYDIIHSLAEAFMMATGQKSDNHQCLFAYLCMNHPELDLQWDFLELLRTRRNGIHYYGESMTMHHWKEIELNCRLHISTLETAVSSILQKSS